MPISVYNFGCPVSQKDANAAQAIYIAARRQCRYQPPGINECGGGGVNAIGGGGDLQGNKFTTQHNQNYALEIYFFV